MMSLRRMWDRVAVYTPVMLMAVLAMASYWLVRNAPQISGPEMEAAPRHVPDYFMRDFSVRVFDAQGKRYLDASGGAAVSCLGHAHSDVLAEDQGEVLDGDVAAHAAPEGDRAGTMRRAAQHLHPVERIAAHRTAAVAAQRHVQRAHVDAGPDQPFDDLELMHVARNEVGLDLVGAKTLQMFDVEGRGRIDDHAAPRLLDLRIVEVGTLDEPQPNSVSLPPHCNLSEANPKVISKRTSYLCV